MKKLFLFCILISTLSVAQSPQFHNFHLPLANSSTYALFGDQVKFRAEPDSKSEVLALLKIGSEVQIIEKTEITLFYNGIESPFYKVKYQEQEGYILGGLIAIEKKTFDAQTYLFAFKLDKENIILSIRMLNANSEFIEQDVVLVTPQFNIKITDNRGLDTVDTIIYINYLADACGIDGGGIYLFRTEDRLVKAIELIEVADGGVFWFTEALIFPNETDGVQSKLVYRKEYGESIDEESNWVEVEKVSRELEWIDGQIFPKLENEMD